MAIPSELKITRVISCLRKPQALTGKARQGCEAMMCAQMFRNLYLCPFAGSHICLSLLLSAQDPLSSYGHCPEGLLVEDPWGQSLSSPQIWLRGRELVTSQRSCLFYLSHRGCQVKPLVIRTGWAEPPNLSLAVPEVRLWSAVPPRQWFCSHRREFTILQAEAAPSPLPAG